MTFAPNESGNEALCGRVVRRRSAWLARRLLLTTALGAGLGLASPALAQNGAQNGATSGPTSAAGEGGAGDIVVTARRVEERLQDVPISITVFNQQQLTNRNVVNAEDLARFTPSLNVANNFGSNTTTFTMRGFYQDPNTQPSVGVFFADVVAPRGAANNLPVGNGAGPGDFFDLQNVQVLKGPQGTLFGRNTTGGDILLVPQKPTDKLEGYVEGSIGNYDMRRIQAVINIPITDTMRFRLGVDHDQRDGYIHNRSGIGPDDFDDVNYTAVRASLVEDLTPNLENYTIATYSRSHTHGTAATPIGCNPEGALGGVFCPAVRRDQAAGFGFYDVDNPIADASSVLTTWRIINTTTWQASDTVTIKNIASYAQLKLVDTNPLFGITVNTADVAAFYSAAVSAGLTAGFGTPVTATYNFGSQAIPFSSSTHAPGLPTSNESTFTEELQIQKHSADNRLQFQAGGYIEMSDPLGNSGAAPPVFLSCTNAAAFQCTDPTASGLVSVTPAAVAPYAPAGLMLGNINYTTSRVKYRDYALYAQGSYAVTDQIKLTGGIRYTWDREYSNGNLIGIFFPAPNTPLFTCVQSDATYNANGFDPNQCAESVTTKSAKPTWLLDIDYKPTNDILLYAKWSRGYRAGGVNLQAPVVIRSFAPEKVDTYEGGLKMTFRGAIRGTFNVAAFYNNFTHQQLPVSLVRGSNNATATTNVGRSRIYGAEVEASITPFNGFTLDAAYTYLNTKLLSATNPVGDFTGYTVVLPSSQVGLPLLLSPKNQFTVTGTYTLPLPQSVGEVSVAATFSHTDKQLSNYADLAYPDVPEIYALRYLQARNLLNLNLNWHKVANSPVDLSLFATNVTNQKYYAYISGLATVGWEGGNPGEPRMYGIRLRYSFGE